MAQSLASLLVIIGADTKQYQRELSAAQRQMQELGSSFTRIGTELSAAVSLPLALAGKSAIEAAGSFEQARIGFT